MEVKINKEIREYTEGIFLGLSLRQCLFSFLACVMAVIFYFLFIDRLGMEITSWLCMISAAPFAALGFIRFQGMNAEQIVVCAIRSLLITREFPYYSCRIFVPFSFINARSSFHFYYWAALQADRSTMTSWTACRTVSRKSCA